MGYYDSAGRWINTNPVFQGAGVMPQQNTAGTAWPQYQPSNQFSIVSIQGRSIAEDYPVAPGARVMMIDANEMVAYIKERNAQGALLPFLTYDLVLREDQPKQETVAASAIDYDKIRSIIKEEVDKKFANKQRNSKEAK